MMTENSSQAPAQTSAPSMEAASSAPATTNPGTEVSTSPAQGSSETQTPTTPVAGANGQAPVVPPGTPAPYTPNYKFKAYGKEYEFEDWSKNLVKDAETEEKLRKLYAKAYGFDPMKEKLEKRESEFTQKEQHYSNLDRLAGEISHHLGSKDFDNLFGKNGLNVSFDDLADWVGRKIDAMKNPAMAAEAERQAQIRYQNFVLSQENQNWQKQFQDVQHQTMSLQLETTLARPEVSTFAQAFDAKMGKIGAFRDSVAQIGEYEYLKSNGQKVISPEEAITQAMKQYAPFVGMQAPPQGNQAGMSPNPANAQQTQPVQNPQQPTQAPIIPHVAGRGSSPVKKGFKNLDELKKYAKTL